VLISHDVSKNKFIINNIYGNSGFGYIKSKISGFNNAAKNFPFLIITDLDEYECPPVLIKE